RAVVDRDVIATERRQRERDRRRRDAATAVGDGPDRLVQRSGRLEDRTQFVERLEGPVLVDERGERHVDAAWDAALRERLGLERVDEQHAVVGRGRLDVGGRRDGRLATLRGERGRLVADGLGRGE